MDKQKNETDAEADADADADADAEAETIKLWSKQNRDGEVSTRWQLSGQPFFPEIIRSAVWLPAEAEVTTRKKFGLERVENIKKHQNKTKWAKIKTTRSGT